MDPHPGWARVGYQGEPGAYSELAVHVLFPDVEAEPHRTVRAVFDAVTGGAIDRAVVPLENTLAGSINETYDLLARGDTHIVGEVVVAVDHALLALPGASLEDVRVVSSHPQALAQCDEYLAELDVDAGTDDGALAAALDELREEAEMVQVLGSYAGWRTDPATPA